jgi:hypothetical protein
MPCAGPALQAFKAIDTSCIGCAGAGVCHVECQEYCSGGAVTLECLSCFSPTCPIALQACLQN